MTLVKVGDIIINMDLVMDVEFEDEAVVLTFAIETAREHPTEYQTRMFHYERRFQGDEAAALRRWLESEATDVMRPPSHGDW